MRAADAMRPGASAAVLSHRHAADAMHLAGAFLGDGLDTVGAGARTILGETHCAYQ